MHNRYLLAFAVLTAITRVPLPAQAPRNIHPRSCPRADNILPNHGDALKGRVRVKYSPAADSTTLDTGGPLTARSSARMPGHGPATTPVAQLTILLRGGEADVVERGEQPPVVMLVTDDSASRELSPIKFGTFMAKGPTAPPRWVVRIPLSAELDPPDLLAIARARDAAVQVGSVKIPIDDGERRNISALYVTMLCGIE